MPKNWTISRMKEILLLVIRYIFWYLFVEFWLHFIYAPALKYKTVLFKRMDLWTMSGMCCCISVFFMMKYIFFYGITRPFMKMDGIEPPDHPKCVGRIHCYSELWRYFDVQGLENT